MPYFIALFLAAPVTLENRVSRLPDLVDEIGTKGRLKLAVSRELANELVYVRAKPRIAEEWLRLVAEAASAEWEKDGSTLRLTRSSAMKGRLESEELAERTEQYLAAVRRSVGMPNPGPATAAQFEEAVTVAASVPRSSETGYAVSDERMAEADRDLLPWQRFLRRTLSSETLGAFATVPPGHIGYWSTRATAVQRSLRIPTSAFRSYDQERKLLTSIIAVRRGGTTFREKALGVSHQLFRAETSSPVVSLNMRVERPKVDQLYLNGSLLDANGAEVETFTFLVPLALKESTWPNYRNFAAKQVPMTPRLRVIQSVAWSGGGEAEVLTPTALDPAKNEPGDLFARPLLDVLCEQGDTEAVVGIPDEAVSALLNPLGANERLGSFAEGLERSTRLRITQGMVVGRPRYPMEAAKMRLDRTVLRDLLGLIGRSHGYSLDVVANYCLRQRLEAGATRLESIVLVAAGAGGPMNNLLQSMFDVFSGGRETLRFYGLLPPAIRQALWRGEPVPLANIPSSAWESLTRRIYRHRISFSPTIVFAGRSREDAPMGLPNGIPAGAFVKGKAESRPGFILASPPFGPIPTTMDALGYMVHMRETRDPRFNFDSLPDIRDVPLRPIHQRTLAFRINFAPDVALDSSLSDYSLASRIPVTFARLPKEFRAIADETLDAMRKRTEEDRQRRNGGVHTPPPRS